MSYDATFELKFKNLIIFLKHELDSLISNVNPENVHSSLYQIS